MASDALPLAPDEPRDGAPRVTLGPRAVLLRGFARERALELVAAVVSVAAVSPFRHMVTPGGWEMSAAMTNCGQVGWVTDRTGYRYDAIDPATGRPWPAMPRAFAVHPAHDGEGGRRHRPGPVIDAAPADPEDNARARGGNSAAATV